ncbi:hypothetical protein Tsubulata_014138 [Turnera subulata]|uniref:Amine oxidase domain-containing protein n=1 Tax=Turnera subulata TaxID=218843 RepID=A0A9Q0GMY7_9ROSI|nr:hypothetical protein Tsubulata_014138 [Turnera subulata]
MDPLLDSAPPESSPSESLSFNDRFRDKMHKSVFWARFSRQALSLGQKDLVFCYNVAYGDENVFCYCILQSDVLKATLATDAVTGSTVSVHTPGSGYVLLHHVMGETDGDRGIWSYVEGGMGSISLAISNAAREAGTHVATNAEVSKLLLSDSGTVNGDLVPENVLPDDFVRAVQYSDYSPATTKLNIAVDKLPQFQSCKLNLPEAGPQHVGSIFTGSESSSVIGYDMLTPPDLEREIGLTGGNIFHGAMGLDSLFLMRPVKGWSNYRTPIQGLYLCGSGAHPGGGVMGAPGRNAARVVLQDVKK